MSHAEAHIQWAFTLMSRRLARQLRRNEAVPATLAAAA
ncbi:hypothetical protein FB563_6158 [Streptomyces puniciscabiei]|uniref:Uncharacterized protein n=1 Tax=Streptomyces puniciscabiei TaxID=164348 RepID=A0A542TH93_9ACTN|nr:hypothetical protein FB563_6158 [Streptomyces puniciscabiei]